MKTKHAEIIVASVLLLISLFEFVATAHYHVYSPFTPHDPNARAYRALHLKYSFVNNYMLPELLVRFTFYFSFLWMACSYPNKFLARRKWIGFMLTTILGGICTWLLLYLKIWMRGFHSGNAMTDYSIYSVLTLYGALLIYQAIKYAALYYFTNGKQSNSPTPLKTEVTAFVICWVIIMAACFTMNIYWGWKLFFGFMVPCCFIVYMVLMYYIIPAFWHGQTDKSKFWLTIIVITLLINLPLTGYFAYKSAYELWTRGFMFILSWAAQLVVLLPLSIYIYYRRKATSEEITGLQTGLSRADADLSFLRSQIDPHFLFNALNTLYGVALKEHAEYTADGVQKLGDMMRFMLHDNNREQISLAHEIQYLQNYIAFQKLRTAGRQTINVQVELPDAGENLNIAPMLLIPFVENAFKHGISLKEASWINVKLYFSGKKMHFEVDNSAHADNADKIDDTSSGIGLDNVKKRLELIYPGRYSLNVTNSKTSHSVELSIDLD
ncbi:sensor histidine kinase [Mucilaginibacter ginkgonis]|uniref:Histidine kinase n=1 Tax=Mucilaginibacter ginkgonis TaxID=2682091 RepID=A0A6I4INR1_9SPHI|nr:histidine kinase [Mucilaginibacter ginkgonis]QQL49041.1 histidine kinase [Mucilaginibacter ginkgonis]